MGNRRQHTLVTCALVVALAAAACGGGGDGDSAADTTPTPTPTAGSAPESTPTGTAEPTPAPDEASDPTAAPTVAPTPELAEGALLYVPERLTTVPAVEAASTAEGHIAAMFADVIVTLAAGGRLADADASGAVEYWIPEVAPDVVIDVFTINAALTAELTGIIEAYSLAGAGAGYDPEFTEYFEVRATAARNFREANAILFDTLRAARELDIDERICVAESLEDGSVECDDGPGADLLDPFFDISLSDLELPDDAAEEFREDPLCAAWGEAAAAIAPDATALAFIEYAIDDTLLDTRFLGRSECRYEADLGEDVTPDPEPALAAWAAIYEEVAAYVAAEGARFVEEADGSGLDFAEEAELLVFDAAVLRTAADAAAAQFATVAEGTTRLQLLVLADWGRAEATFNGGLAELDLRVAAFGDDAVECWLGRFDERASCEPDLAEPVDMEASLYETYLATRESSFARWEPYDEAFARVHDDDLEEARCGVWLDAVAALDPTSQSVVDELNFIPAFDDLDVAYCG